MASRVRARKETLSLKVSREGLERGPGTAYSAAQVAKVTEAKFQEKRRDDYCRLGFARTLRSR